MGGLGGGWTCSPGAPSYDLPHAGFLGRCTPDCLKSRSPPAPRPGFASALRGLLASLTDGETEGHGHRPSCGRELGPGLRPWAPLPQPRGFRLALGVAPACCRERPRHSPWGPLALPALLTSGVAGAGTVRGHRLEGPASPRPETRGGCIAHTCCRTRFPRLRRSRLTHPRAGFGIRLHSVVTTVEPLPPLPGSSPRPPSQPPAPSARSIPTQLPEGPARVWIRPGPPLAPGRAALGDPALPSAHAPASPQGPGSTAQAQPRQPPACSRGLCTDPVPPGPASPSFSFDCLSTLALSGHLGSGRARTGTGATFSAVVSTWSCALKCHWLPPPSWVIREASRVHSSLGPRPARHDLSGVTETPLPEAPCHERPCCRAQLGLFLAAGSGPHVLVSARSPLQPGCSSSFLHGLSPNSHLGGPSSP